MSERYYGKYEAPIAEKVKPAEVAKPQTVNKSAGVKSKPYSYAIESALRGGSCPGEMTDRLYR